MKNDTRAESKISVLTDILSNNFGEHFNLARIKFISLFIMALSKVQTVSFERLASAFDHPAQYSSSLRRIQRFFADYMLDHELIAKLVFKLLPEKPPYRLAMDRTNWKFGKKDINILCLSVIYQGVAFPILYKMLPKFGNSNTSERIHIIQRYIDLFGIDTIDCLVADREFVGQNWIGFLNSHRIRYHIRIRDNFWITNPRTGVKSRVFWLFKDLKLNSCKVHPNLVLINNQYCYLSGSLVRNKEGKAEYQILVSFNKPDEAQSFYKERWQTETAFRALKSAGYNLEDTHLTDLERIEKLLSLIFIAFAWTYRIGIYLDSLTPIKIKKHGRKAHSYFKYGLLALANALFTNNLNLFETYCKFLSCT